jgi:acyl-CoA synthetase (AMP-forming)/AMP-acid ligase II
MRLLNRPHFIATFLAVLRIGAVAVPTPPLLRSTSPHNLIRFVDKQ